MDDFSYSPPPRLALIGFSFSKCKVCTFGNLVAHSYPSSSPPSPMPCVYARVRRHPRCPPQHVHPSSVLLPPSIGPRALAFAQPLKHYRRGDQESADTAIDGDGFEGVRAGEDVDEDENIGWGPQVHNDDAIGGPVAGRNPEDDMSQSEPRPGSREPRAKGKRSPRAPRARHAVVASGAMQGDSASTTTRDFATEQPPEAAGAPLQAVVAGSVALQGGNASTAAGNVATE